jgi:hypothetical protein
LVPHSAYANPDPGFWTNADPVPGLKGKIFQMFNEILCFHQYINNLYKRHCLKYASIH